MGSPATILGQFTGLSRGSLTARVSAEFPAGGLAASDQKPILNWALDKFAFSERIGGYIDIGATDPIKNLDVLWSANALVPIYADYALQHDQPPQMAGINPPKAVFLRCLVGSGFLYVNVNPELMGADPPALENKQTPFPLHAGLGMFYYTFPKREPWRTIMTDPGDPTKKIMIPSALVTLGLRTFEDSNRFQLEIFR
jgi:hypothetical protein